MNLLKQISLTLSVICLSMPFRILAISFTDVTQKAGVSGTGIGNGVAFVDYDNDGDLDIYVSSDPHDILYRNNSDGTFSDITAKIGIFIPDDGVGIAFGDYDNDGDHDLYIPVNDGSDLLLQNQGGKLFVNVSDEVGINNPARARSASFIDFDNDGYLDIYVVNEWSANLLYKNINGKFFIDVAERMGVNNVGPGRCQAWGDYDNDGDLDLYVTNRGMQNILYRNDRDSFKDVTVEAGCPGGGDSTGVAFADYDNDGYLDLYVGDAKGAYLYHNERDGTFKQVDSKIGINIHMGPSSPAFADFDNDGYQDLFVLVWEGNAVLYRNNGDGTFSDATQISNVSAEGNGWGITCGDYNNDGWLDIYASFATRNNILYQNDGGDNNWLQIRMIGTISNRDCIGTRVKLITNNQTQIREVQGSSGYGSQNSILIQFGLGKANIVDSLEIRWPSGVKIKMNNIKANRVITVEEGVLAVDEAGYASDIPPTRSNELNVNLMQNYPNPFNPETWIPYELSRSSNVQLLIYSSNGSLVRTINVGYREAGKYISKDKAIYWDGRNDYGEEVSAGIYYYQLKVDDHQVTKKMVLIR